MSNPDAPLCSATESLSVTPLHPTESCGECCYFRPVTMYPHWTSLADGFCFLNPPPTPEVRSVWWCGRFKRLSP